MAAVDNDMFPSHLLAAHEELCQLIDHLSVAVVTWKSGQLHYTNDAFIRLVGLSENQLQQQSDFDALISHPGPEDSFRTGTYRKRYRLKRPHETDQAIWELGVCRDDRIDACLIPVDDWAAAEHRAQRLEATLGGVLTLSASPMLELTIPELRVARHNEAAELLFWLLVRPSNVVTNFTGRTGKFAQR